MVGEIRDNETTELAIQASLTGHLVFSTLHTNNAAGALPRLLDLKAEPYLVSSTTTCVVGQRVVREICSACKTARAITDEVFATLTKSLSSVQELNRDKVKLFVGKGCRECNNSGYLGRIGIYEVLTVSDKISQMILRRETAQHIEEQAVAEGMLTMKQDGFLKVLEGITTMEEVLRVAEE
jgi:type II secretory ATPase GspE/PulE/Tfp pilus assembly ATPase PilB-like protein